MAIDLRFLGPPPKKVCDRDEGVMVLIVGTALRSRSELERVYQRGLALRRSLTRDHSPSNDRYVRRVNGVVSALSWVLDISRLPPIRNHPIRVTDRDAISVIAQEIAVAKNKLNTVQVPSDHDFVSGALDALHWAIDGDARPPT